LEKKSRENRQSHSLAGPSESPVRDPPGKRDPETATYAEQGISMHKRATLFVFLSGGAQGAKAGRAPGLQDAAAARPADGMHSQHNAIRIATQYQLRMNINQ